MEGKGGKGKSTWEGNEEKKEGNFKGKVKRRTQMRGEDKAIVIAGWKSETQASSPSQEGHSPVEATRRRFSQNLAGYFSSTSSLF